MVKKIIFLTSIFVWTSFTNCASADDSCSGAVVEQKIVSSCNVNLMAGIQVFGGSHLELNAKEIVELQQCGKTYEWVINNKSELVQHVLNRFNFPSIMSVHKMIHFLHRFVCNDGKPESGSQSECDYCERGILASENRFCLLIAQDGRMIDCAKGDSKVHVCIPCLAPWIGSLINYDSLNQSSVCRVNRRFCMNVWHDYHRSSCYYGTHLLETLV